MKLLPFLAALIACCGLISCGSNDSDDLLSNNPVLGRWEIVSNSHDATLDCCEFLKFELDDNEDDLIGNYVNSGPDFNIQGSFEVFVDDQNILIYHNNEYELHRLDITGKELMLTGQEIIKTYRKID